MKTALKASKFDLGKECGQNSKNVKGYNLTVIYFDFLVYANNNFAVVETGNVICRSLETIVSALILFIQNLFWTEHCSPAVGLVLRGFKHALMIPCYLFHPAHVI